MNTRSDENAVSPVIGTVLMVAVTVIIGAMIGAYVFGLTTNVQKPRQIGVLHVSQSNNDIIINYHGGPDSDALAWFRITAPDGTLYYSTANSLTSDFDERAAPDLGASFVLVNNATPQNDRVIVVGHFIDGDEQIIYDAWL
ncbi:MAG: type IV pilin N-terminal domain-containing protein [Methanomicrobiales archaeon]|nr:type IV pilin N-terminal domain-containing protein [Methanomicrobiales archaeon]